MTIRLHRNLAAENVRLIQWIFCLLPTVQLRLTTRYLSAHARQIFKSAFSANQINSLCWCHDKVGVVVGPDGLRFLALFRMIYSFWP